MLNLIPQTTLSSCLIILLLARNKQDKRQLRFRDFIPPFPIDRENPPSREREPCATHGGVEVKDNGFVGISADDNCASACKVQQH